MRFVSLVQSLAVLGFALLAEAAAPVATYASELQVAVDFPTVAEGIYEASQAREDWPGLQWFALRERGTLVPAGETALQPSLRLFYPEGSVGPGQGGGQFRVNLPPRDEYFLSYDLQFEEGFDFRRGGKLPGLSGGRGNTGGHRPTGDGWSARYMWGREGRLTIYLYHPDQRGRYGDSLTTGVQLEPGRWYRLTQRIRVNDPDQQNGLLQVWVDGTEVLFRDDLRYRNVAEAQVDIFYFSTFHGGNSADWAPQRDSFARFARFRIGTTKPAVVPNSAATAEIGAGN